MPEDTAKKMQQLYSQFGELEGVTIELHKDLVAVSVVNQQATATVFLQGAQLSHYQPKNQPPVIWCSEQCSFQQGQPLRGGIPVCWPWFGDFSRNPDIIKQQIPGTDNPPPAHGFARNREWHLDNVELVHPGHTRLQLSLSVAPDEDPHWPFATQLTLTIDISKSLTLSLNVINNDQQTIHFTSALHSYFAVGEIEQVTIDGLDGLPYTDCVDNWSEQRQQGAIAINQEVDRIYRDVREEITLIDSSWQRVIALNTNNSRTAVVWNPWKEKSKRLSQYSNDSYQKMLCIETANIAEDYTTLAAGEQKHLTVTISNANIS